VLSDQEKAAWPGSFAVFALATAWIVTVIVLCMLVGKGVLRSSMHIQGALRAFRVLLGFGVTFWITPMRIWLAWADCDYFCDFANKLASTVTSDQPSCAIQTRNLIVAKEDYELTMCFGGIVMRALGVSAFICVVLHFVVLFFGSLMHINDPRSWSVAARPHSWCELINITTAYPIIFWTVILNGRLGELLGAAILVSRGFLALFTILLQPFYSTSFTDLRAGFFMGEAWSGIALISVSASKQRTTLQFTIVSVVLYVLFAIGGFVLSRLWRWYLLSKVRAEYAAEFSLLDPAREASGANAGARGSAQGKSKEAGVVRDSADTHTHVLVGSGSSAGTWHGARIIQRGTWCTTYNNMTFFGSDRSVQALEDDNDVRRSAIWQIVTEEFVPGVSNTPRQWFSAVLTEVKTRFILEGKTNMLPHPVLIDIAENIYLKAIKDCVQSTYLQLQYVIFLSAYRENFAQSKLKLEEVDRNAKVNLGLQYSIFRKRKDLDQLQQEHESQNMDSKHGQKTMGVVAGYEDMQKREIATTEAYGQCRERLLGAWKAIGQLQRGANITEKLAGNVPLCLILGLQSNGTYRLYHDTTPCDVQHAAYTMQHALQHMPHTPCISMERAMCNEQHTSHPIVRNVQNATNNGQRGTWDAQVCSSSLPMPNGKLKTVSSSC
jgi:hypothetical protein